MARSHTAVYHLYHREHSDRIVLRCNAKGSGYGHPPRAASTDVGSLRTTGKTQGTAEVLLVLHSSSIARMNPLTLTSTLDLSSLLFLQSVLGTVTAVSPRSPSYNLPIALFGLYVRSIASGPRFA